MVRPKFKVGNKFQLTEDAIENYGEEYRGRVFTVESVATKYMPSKEFFQKGKPQGYHPGFDEGIGQALYDANELNFSVYEFEIKRA